MQPEHMNAANSEYFIPLLGPAEVAKWLGVSVAWVRDHATRKSPRLPAVKAGKLLRFRPIDVKDFIQDRWHAGDVRSNGQRL
jgi:Helix-turn-helix domain